MQNNLYMYKLQRSLKSSESGQLVVPHSRLQIYFNHIYCLIKIFKLRNYNILYYHFFLFCFATDFFLSDRNTNMPKMNYKYDGVYSYKVFN